MKYRFTDTATVQVRSGKGGPGSISFRREKFIPFGGPDGGNGGHGGDVIIVADVQLATLLDYRYKRSHEAKNGCGGEGCLKTGADGADAILPVPCGTEVYDNVTGELIADLVDDGQRLVVCRGGRGGKGNTHFKSSIQQAPRKAQPGEPWEEKSLRFELKLLADVGLIGFPNVGKSSLIAKISAARPKIADYPFTTLVPNLGVVRVNHDLDYVVADVPGLIVGASEGAGLGTQFLRHVERVGVIVHMVTVIPDDESREPIADFEAIEAELRAHNPDLAKVPRVLVLNRADLNFVTEAEERVADYARVHQLPFFTISAVTGAGVDQLSKSLGYMVAEQRKALRANAEAVSKNPVL